VIGAVLAAGSRRRYLDVQRAMRVNEPLPAPSVAAYLPWGVAAVGLAGLVAAVVQLV